MTRTPLVMPDLIATATRPTWETFRHLRLGLAERIGQEPGIALGPVGLQGGRFWRATAVWMLPLDGKASNHGLHLDWERGCWSFRCWIHGVGATEVDTGQRPPSRELMRCALASIDFPGVR